MAFEAETLARTASGLRPVTFLSPKSTCPAAILSLLGHELAANRRAADIGRRDLRNFWYPSERLTRIWLAINPNKARCSLLQIARGVGEVVGVKVRLRGLTQSSGLRR